MTAAELVTELIRVSDTPSTLLLVYVVWSGLRDLREALAGASKDIAVIEERTRKAGTLQTM